MNNHNNLPPALLSSPTLNLFPSLNLLSSKSNSNPLSLLRHLLLLALRLLLLLLSPFLIPPSSSNHQQFPSPLVDPTYYSPHVRALSHVLSLVSLTPTSSRKYDHIRSLADRLLDDNLRISPILNRQSLSLSFLGTLDRLESSLLNSSFNKSKYCRNNNRSRGGLVDAVVGMVKSEIRRWREDVAEVEDEVEVGKMAAEVVWLAGKMAECGAVEEAVRTWAEAKGLARAAIAADARVQVAFVRVSALLFNHANAKQFGRKGKGEDECLISHYRMAMLKSWLPLLCRATNGTDTPILSSGEKAKMVKVLKEMIETLKWEEQEEVLALWLHHFTSCPDSDWPNLESCYTRWYSKSRDLFLK